MTRPNTLIAPATLVLLALAACEPTPPAGPTPDTATQPPGTISTQPSAQPSATAKPAKHDIAPSVPIATAGPAEIAVNASNGFGMALYQELKTKPGNFVFSPASISVALAMTYGGAKGDTAAQMAKTLQAGADADAFHDAWATQLNGWQNHKGAEIAVANRLFGDKKYTFEAPYLAHSKSRYGAPLQAVDFAGAPEKQRVKINGWVAEQTHDRILDLIPKNGVTVDTRMALVNAIYFKAQWNEAFPKRRTKDDTFTTADGTKVTTPMMMHTTHARYGEVDGAQLMELRYKGGGFATLFVLPPQTEKIGDLESKLDKGLLDQWIGALKGQRVQIRLPRFTIKPGGAVELSDPLKAMGMKLPFVPSGADFTGITKPANLADRLYIEKVYHKAFVAMDEAGTEAAAATAVLMARAGGAAQEPLKFHADRPFLFFIRDTSTNLVMFAGRVVDPTK